LQQQYREEGVYCHRFLYKAEYPVLFLDLKSYKSFRLHKSMVRKKMVFLKLRLEIKRYKSILEDEAYLEVS